MPELIVMPGVPVDIVPLVVVPVEVVPLLVIVVVAAPVMKGRPGRPTGPRLEPAAWRGLVLPEPGIPSPVLAPAKTGALTLPRGMDPGLLTFRTMSPNCSGSVSRP